MAYFILLCILLSGCGPRGQGFDLSMPINFKFRSLGLGERLAVQIPTIARNAILALGGTTDGDTPNPTIVVELGNDTLCRKEFLAWGRAVDPTIWICPDVEGAADVPGFTHALIYHELGHVLGADHLPCKTGAIMGPNVGCTSWRDGVRSDTPPYLPVDIAMICKWTVGGVCDIPQNEINVRRFHVQSL